MIEIRKFRKMGYSYLNLLFLFFLLFSSTNATWSSQVLQLQRELGKDEEIQYIGGPRTYKSYNSPNSGYTFATDQPLTLIGQLDAGIRVLELDVNRINAITPPVLVCQGNENFYNICMSIGWAECGLVNYGDATGCFSTDPTLNETLQELQNWTSANPSEFVLLIVNSNAELLTSDIDPLMTAFFGNGYFTVAEKNSLFPTRFPTLTELQGLGKNIAYIGPAIGGLPDPFYPYQSGDIVSDFIPFPACISSAQSTIPADENGNFYADQRVIVVGNVTLNGPALTGTMDATAISELNDCGFWIGLDDISDAVLNISMWSFALNYPISSPTLNCVYLNATNMLWQNGDCTKIYKAACQNDSDPYNWVLSNVASTWYTASSHCPSGTVFYAPSNGAMNKVLKDVLAATSETAIWLKFNDIDVEGVWTRNWTGTIPQSTTNSIDTSTGGTTQGTFLVPSSSTGSWTSLAQQWFSVNYIYIAAIGGALLIGICIIICFCFIRKKKKDQDLNRQSSFFELRG
jgi:hypothetical protein